MQKKYRYKPYKRSIMKVLSIPLLLIILALIGCKKKDKIVEHTINESEIYFPEIGSDEWETTTLENLNWNESAIDDLNDFLSQNGTRGFILLKNGKIVIEKFWGNNVQNNAPFTKDSNWYWASAGKTLTAILVGLAQEQNLLDIDNKTSDYLGNSWSSLSLEKENLVTLRHQLTMTTGLDYGVDNPDCTEPECLQYKSDAGSQWYYHNAPYTLLEKVVSNASGLSYNEFTNQNIEAPIGMEGTWLPLGDNNLYWSTPRDAARFGLLLLNHGKWLENEVISDLNYFESLTNSSQSLNPSYGFLTWLNGKSSLILPGLPNSFNLSLSKNAPDDLFAAIGKNGQFIDVVPSRGIVVIRMGEAPEDSLVPTVFHDDMWAKINAVIN